MKEFIEEAVQSAEKSDHIQKTIQKILIKMCAERDYSAQEIFRVVMRWPFFRSSRSFAVINLSKNAWQMITLNSHDGNVNVSNPLEKYKERPEQFQNTTLKEYHTSVYKRGTNFSVRRVPLILRIIPQSKYDPGRTNNEEFFKQEVLLNVPWRRFEDLNPNNHSWKDIYEEKLGNDRIRHIDLEHLLDNFEDSQNIEEAEDSPDTERPYDWMNVAAGPRQLHEEIDLGRREVDIRHEWHTIQNGPTLHSLKTFIEQEKEREFSRERDVGLHFHALPSFTFSNEQQELIDIFLRNKLIFFKDVQNKYRSPG